MDPATFELLKTLGLPGLAVLATSSVLWFEARVRPLVIRSLASRVAVERKLGVTPADITAIEDELRGKVLPGG